MVELLCPTAIFAGTHADFFSTASVPLLSCLMHLGGRLFFVPCGAMAFRHTNKKFLHGLMAAFLFCGGNMVAAMPLFRARLFPRRLPPHPRTPARARAYARVG
jgi:hypothetical protein